MPTNRKLLGAAAFSLALAGGGVAGAVLGTPNPSGAQDSTEDTSTAAAPADPERRVPGPPGRLARRRGGGHRHQRGRPAHGPGGRAVDRAGGRGGGRRRADRDRRPRRGRHRTPRGGDRRASLTAWPRWSNGRACPDRGGRGGPGGFGGRGPGLEAAADAIGISVDELRTALRDGSSLAEVAAANDVDVQTVIDALVAEATAHLDEAVENGRLTEAEAAERAADLDGAHHRSRER